MADKLSKSLSQFIANTTSPNSFNSPFDQPNEELQSIHIDEKEVMKRSKETKEEKKKAKKEKDKISTVLERGNQLISSVVDEEFVDDFDNFIGDHFLDDEDVELRRNLLRYGRKYARDTKTSGETSEITKAYSETEKILSDLLDQVDEDTKKVETDIANLRMVRTRNFKALSDLINSKAQFHNTALNAIKELNNMKKTQFELQMKAEKSRKESQDNDGTANMAIQQLFGIGRDNIMGSFGGYGGVSGSDEVMEDGTHAALDGVDEDEYIQKKYFNESNNSPETDGDKFLKYEGMGVHYILLYDDNDYREIIAEDKDGNIVPDYPLPSDPSKLHFELSVSTGTATDDLANNYELRHI